MHADETVLSAGRIALAIGMKGDVVNGAEMVANASEFLLEDEVEEARLELARLREEGSVDGFLATAEQDVIEDGRYGRRVHWLLSFVGLELPQTFDVEKLGRKVLQLFGIELKI